MKILKLTVSNVKRIVAAEITPDSNIVRISGRNGSGKTSILDSICYAIGGKDCLRDVPYPIRRGEDYARVIVETDDLVITRTWTSDDDTFLKVTDKAGRAFSSPQKVLDELTTKIAFDPVRFLSLERKEQIRMIAGLYGIDMESVERRRHELYERRRDVNREVRRVKSLLESLPPIMEGTPDEEVSVSALVDELEELRAHRVQQEEIESSIRKYRRNIEEIDEKSAEIQGQIAALQGRLKHLQEVREEGERMIVDATEKLRAIPDAKARTEQIQRDIKSADEINLRVRAKRELVKLEHEHNELVAQSSALTALIERLDNEVQQSITDASLAISGDGEILFDGIPLQQRSMAEQIRLSLKLAMGMNPQLRVIRIADGSLLDSESMSIVAEMAHEHDFQVWVERVGDGPGEDGAFYIEEGVLQAQ